MTSSSAQQASDDRQDRIVEVVADCLGRFAGGVPVNANDIQVSYPDLMPELADVLARAVQRAEKAKSDVTVTYAPARRHTDETIEQRDPAATLDLPSTQGNETQSIVRFDHTDAGLQFAGHQHLGPTPRRLRIHAEGGRLAWRICKPE